MPTQQPHQPSHELEAAALRAYGTLSAGRAQPVPVPCPGVGGVLGLTVFLTVYAAHELESERAR
ncbi:hypothetical protein AB0I66_42120 [Streptomyces sp. NPDC050439]|uniref:hypothetical protein n=1 Tax=unclassified Streptomyces TaxID=2593676 RepID=UPI003437C5C4